MCCFSEPVEHVSSTRIFARDLGDERQSLIYSMRFAAAGEMAMILPLPVPPGSAEDAVRFVSLEGYPELFGDVSRAFPMIAAPLSRGSAIFPLESAAQHLVVHDVGDFEASFAPTLADFERLDPRFKLAPEVWDQLPQYGDWGFAVFKLKPKERGFWERLFRRPAKERGVHPMAFEFPRRDPGSLFFPTVHVHDGEVHETARFDHTLYCQPDPVTASTFGWDRSEGALGGYVDASRAAGLIDPEQPCFRSFLFGTRPNRDQVIFPPTLSDPAKLLRRGPCFELQLRATASYWDPPPDWAEHPEAWKTNASKNLEPLGEQLEANLARALEAQRDALGLRDFDETLRAYAHRSGHLYPQLRAEGETGPPEPGESILLELEVSDDRVEPQRLRVALAEPPDVERVLAIQRAADAALSRVELASPA